jgi:hypothetical protein
MLMTRVHTVIPFWNGALAQSLAVLHASSCGRNNTDRVVIEVVQINKVARRRTLEEEWRRWNRDEKK